MARYIESLFIGGPLDKEWKSVDSELQVVYVPVVEPINWKVDAEVSEFRAFTKLCYTRNSFRYHGIKVPVFIVKDAELPPVTEVAALLKEKYK
jgi:hypothetical protein